MTPAARFFQALGDETRLALLALLRDGDRTVGDLVHVLGCPQPKVSRHLKVLREAGLVRPHKDGRNVTYAVTSASGWEPSARSWIDALDHGLRLRAARVSTAAGNPPRNEEPKHEKPEPPAPSVARVARKPRRDMETYLL